ncbi:NAD(P)H-dependent oxidoreductase [Sphingomonas sp. LB-2]|uniref:NAD(P)H-dependent oxidoreductase n=1 Tax=Sphingomonas caeni TaxID=2984949 RepID=UPI0022307D3B|nr:NAD(P)H-dependent oxidoreductase [Sphingomonas caeni]MCW3848183.1 NAD(P)H-dependent oxidoreductase [Sphingomonas caeni]
MNALAPKPFAPIRHLVILGHPDPASFCGSVARTYCATAREFGQEATLRDLYALGFDPALKRDEIPREGVDSQTAGELAEDLELVRQADVIVLVYPIWFGMPPAIIKGYVDRVLGAGFTARDIKDGKWHPVLHGKRLTLFTSSASTRPWLEEKGQWTALRHAFETYLQMVFSLRDGGHSHFDAIVPGLKQRFVDEYLAEVRESATRQAAELFEEYRASKVRADRARAFGK